MRPISKPYLPSYFQVWCDPPDESGDELLRIASGRRSLTLKGHSFREFTRHVLPLLDGRHEVKEIYEKTSAIFDREDLEQALMVLTEHGVLVEAVAQAESAEGTAERIQPQLNYFLEMAPQGSQAQSRLAKTRLVIFGLGGAGANLFVSLSDCGIGSIAGVDHGLVTQADTYLSPMLGVADVGRARATVLTEKVQSFYPEIHARAVVEKPESEDQIAAIITGADLVISCLDHGLLNLAYKLNRVLRARGQRWISSELNGAELIVGPGFYSNDAPCFMCYRMRAIACGANPKSGFVQESHFDRAKTDYGDRRENLVFGAGILSNMLGVEAINVLTGLADPALHGRLLVFDMYSLKLQKHVVLRKPGCPTCGNPA